MTDRSVAEEKRAFPRHPICLDAVLTMLGARTHSCQIRDFCLGGMQLVFIAKKKPEKKATRPRQGDIVHIECNVNTSVDGKVENMVFQGRVVRTDGSSAGVSFINPNMSYLEIMHTFATRFEGHKDAATINKANRKILAACVHMIEEVIEPMLKVFQKNAVDGLFKATKDIKETTKQNAYLDALEKLNKSEADLMKSFQSKITRQLHRYAPMPPSRENSKEIISHTSLALIEDDAFEKWLAVSDINSKVTSQNAEGLDELHERLSVLFDTEIGIENNPYGPSLFSDTFQSSIEELHLAHVVSKECHLIFRDVLLNTAPDLYKKLNNYLIENDVLPVLQRKIANPKIHSSPERRTSKEQPPQVSQAGAPPANAAVQQSTAPAQSAAAAVPSSAPAPRADRDLNLFQLAGSLRKLKQGLIRQGGHHISGGVTPELVTSTFAAVDDNIIPNEEVAAHQGDVFSASELLEAISIMPVADVAGTVDDSTGTVEPASALSRVINVLAKNADVVNKQIGEHDGDVIEVAGNMFSSLSQDPNMSETARARLQKMEVPVMKMALLDNDVILENDHVAREVVNKIAELDMYDCGSEEAKQVNKEVDRQIERIYNEFDGTASVFTGVLDKLVELVKRQEINFKENVKGVIAELEKDKALEAPVEQVRVPETKEEVWENWRRKARAMKEDDWVFNLQDPEDPMRLRLAWLATHTERYVFVNAEGHRELVIDINGLTDKLMHGMLVLLDQADEPAMDRAQYLMLQDLHRQLLHESTHDQLTGLVNRREFEKVLKAALNGAKENDEQHTLCYLDLYHFSIINNTCSYEGGDQVLTEVAELLKGAIMDHGTLARMGGDEFAVLLENVPAHLAIGIAQNQINALEDYRFEWKDKYLSVSVNIGLVPLDAQSENIAQILQAAESSCGIASNAGSNRVQVYNPEHQDLSHRQQVMEWATRIDKAVEDEDLLLRCQLINPADSDSEYLPHYEILLGVLDEAGDMISPVDFIEAAEWYNRMPIVDHWVVKEVFSWMADHTDKLEDIDGFAINLSGRSLNDEGFSSFIRQQLEQTGIAADKVCFEVTETIGIANLSNAANFINEIKALGCTFSLDDFGTGLSSYAYLKNLPVDYLKIDGSFVKEMVTNISDYAVVKSITEIGHFLGKLVIAECVEDDNTLELLRSIGVDFVQGYGIERPKMLKNFAD
ncbi:MAG: hypothetical protein BMS9Abin26_1329 [Gammaproteobacteria bacterium]|nr:MAG: hypothetical protein BMS9Abin26_1329 [Gammaproteobacteria bacterium]